MKEIILFYSYGGSTKKLAEARAAKLGADIFEIKDKKRPSPPFGYVSGCFNAMRMKGKPIQPITVKLDSYDKITVMAPVWAGHPVSAAISAFEAIPSGKDVELVMVSSSGKCESWDKIEAFLRNRGCNIVKHSDVVGSQPGNRRKGNP